MAQSSCSSKHVLRWWIDFFLSLPLEAACSPCVTVCITHASLVCLLKEQSCMPGHVCSWRGRSLSFSVCLARMHCKAWCLGTEQFQGNMIYFFRVFIRLTKNFSQNFPWNWLVFGFVARCSNRQQVEPTWIFTVFSAGGFVRWCK